MDKRSETLSKRFFPTDENTLKVTLSGVDTEYVILTEYFGDVSKSTPRSVLESSITGNGSVLIYAYTGSDRREERMLINGRRVSTAKHEIVPLPTDIKEKVDSYYDIDLSDISEEDFLEFEKIEKELVNYFGK